jgi:hypothetical protein
LSKLEPGNHLDVFVSLLNLTGSLPEFTGSFGIGNNVENVVEK